MVLVDSMSYSTGNPVLHGSNSGSRTSIRVDASRKYIYLHPDRFCVGYYAFSGSDFIKYACPFEVSLERGSTCLGCRAQDESLLLHSIEPHPKIVSYIRQPHFLYLAVFLGGVIKVGTAHESRVDERLLEQGAVAAVHLARSDGTTIRRLERRVSKDLFIPEMVSRRSKYDALLRGASMQDATEVLGRMLEEKIDILGSLLSGESTLRLKSTWENSDFRILDSRNGGRSRAHYGIPKFGDTGDVVLQCHAGLGRSMVFNDPVSGSQIVSDMSPLIGRRIEIVDAIDRPPVIQTSLF